MHRHRRCSGAVTSARFTRWRRRAWVRSVTATPDPRTTALGFFLPLSHLDPEPTISLDTDWFYRRGSTAVLAFARGGRARAGPSAIWLTW